MAKAHTQGLSAGFPRERSSLGLWLVSCRQTLIEWGGDYFMSKEDVGEGIPENVSGFSQDRVYSPFFALI
jgi:hypothetical protein